MFFFNSWSSLLRTVVIGVLAYAGLVLLLRVSGKRTLSKMNAFDLIVTVALGSSLASVRSPFVSRLVKSEPKLLVFHGQILHEALRHERVVEAEIYQALRSSGVDSLEQVEAMVLETDGNFSVITRSSSEEKSALRDVHRP